jgi:hypothetical protein
MYEALNSIKELLFDAPANVKSDFNTLVQYFEASTSVKGPAAKYLNKILNNPGVDRDGYTKYLELVAAGTKSELINFIKGIDAKEAQRKGYVRYGEDPLSAMQDLISMLNRYQNPKEILYLLKYWTLDEDGDYTDLTVKTKSQLQELANRVTEKEKDDKKTKNLESYLKKILQISESLSPEGVNDLQEQLGSVIAKINGKSQRKNHGILVGKSLAHACQYSNSEDSYWNQISIYH